MSINKTSKLLRYEIMCLKRDGAPILRSFNSIMKLLFKFNDDIMSPVVNQRYISVYLISFFHNATLQKHLHLQKNGNTDISFVQ